jgi:transposase
MHIMVSMAEKKQGRSYSPEFRSEIVRLYLESGKSLRQIAEDVGVNVNSLRAWVKRAKDATPDSSRRGTPASAAELAELRALRRENRELRMERDFLKKTAAYFASRKK